MNKIFILNLLFAFFNCLGVVTSEGKRPDPEPVQTKSEPSPSASKETGNQEDENIVIVVASQVVGLLVETKNVVTTVTKTLWYSIKTLPENYTKIKNNQL
jgi:hypothetical protein